MKGTSCDATGSPAEDTCCTSHALVEWTLLCASDTVQVARSTLVGPLQYDRL